MKIRVTFKTPDVLDEAQQEEFVKDLAAKFFKHGEYVTIELDTDDQTAVVVPCAKS